VTLRRAIGPIPKPPREPRGTRKSRRSRSPKGRAAMNELLRGTALAVDALPEIIPALSVPVVVSSQRRAVGPALEKRAQIISERYLDAVRALSCWNCGAAGPNHPHHVLRRSRRHTVNDLTAIPACAACHRAVHDGAISGPLGRSHEEAGVYSTQARLFEQRGSLWWLAVMREIQAGIG